MPSSSYRGEEKNPKVIGGLWKCGLYLLELGTLKTRRCPQTFLGQESVEPPSFCNKDFRRDSHKALGVRRQREAPALPERTGRAFHRTDVSAKSYQGRSQLHTQGGEGVPKRGNSIPEYKGGCEGDTSSEAQMTEMS